MYCLDLNTISRAELQQHILKHRSVVACLCAAWCDVCKTYRPKFESLAEQHPENLFLWVDVEDQADLVGDLTIEDFPTLLIQHYGVVTFFGTMQPDITQLKRVIQTQTAQTLEQLQSRTGKQHQSWQIKANLLQRLV